MGMLSIVFLGQDIQLVSWIFNELNFVMYQRLK